MGVLAHISPSIRLPKGCRHSRLCRVTVYEIFRLEAKPQILSNYKIVTIGVSREESASLIERNLFVRPEGDKWKPTCLQLWSPWLGSSKLRDEN
jgi:hypothetical protein